ncbi:DUF454 domain-containing protein [Roseovarius spongiae]|uniref:DUF454 domain-containing protein n=1 Tax=Roseovarius spongiae TaxID=2320272 RepID=A0A3A8AUY1_9RHOB|nr:YbaN family protein [Roseovarius spongiae]RKF14857.1 DUF454 domain-containing protein [Roseovarius spongiae]
MPRNIAVDRSEPIRARYLARLFWRVAGFVALGLGALGAILPLLPTTPFVILAAFCFARGAPALHARLLKSRLFGPALRDWQASGAIAPRYKVLAIAMMLAAFVAAVAASAPPVALIVQVICMALAALFILSRPNGDD